MRVTLHAGLPRLSYNASLNPRPGQADYIRPNPCFYRYITQPIGSLERELRRFKSPSRVTYHLRTGLADVPDAVVQRTRPRAASTATWVNAAMRGGHLRPPLSSKSASLPSLVVSDSPGLLRYLSSDARFGVITSVINPLANQISTRSWNASLASKLQAALDLVLGGQSSWLVPAQQYGAMMHKFRSSSFTQPMLMRSVCIIRADSTVDFMPHYSDTFIRDLYSLLGSSDSIKPINWKVGGSNTSEVMKYGALQHMLPKGHPCKDLSQDECAGSFVAALA